MLSRSDALRILGFSSGESPTEKEIKAAWKKCAKKYHPDVSDIPDAEQRFKLASSAYELLSNTSDDWFDLSEMVHEARQPLNRKPKLSPADRLIKPDSLHIGAVKIPLTCYLLGDSSYIDVSITLPCKDCTEDASQWIPCLLCGETGKIIEPRMFVGTGETKCKQCSGEGWIRKTKCKKCKGKLKVVGTRVIEITIPKSSFPKKHVIVEQGNKGKGCPDGDVYLDLYPDLTSLDLSKDESELLRNLLSRKRKYM